MSIPDNELVLFTSDTHYGHANIIQYCLRPFLSAKDVAAIKSGQPYKVPHEVLKKHDETLVANINAKILEEVKRETAKTNRTSVAVTLFHLGDIAWGRAALDAFNNEIVASARIIVIEGNHDSHVDLCDYFGSNAVFERLHVKYRNQDMILDHYPGDSWNGSHKGWWLLYGHVHGVTTKARLQNPAWALSLDVGVDSHNYAPLSFDEVKKYMDQKKSVWQAWRAAEYGDKSLGSMSISK